MASLISFVALVAVAGTFYLIVGAPIVDRAADLEELQKLTGRDHL
ncbi:hypothetical protein ACFWZ7_26200 [Nocardiopsis alba]